MDKNSITNPPLRFILKKFEVVEIVDLVTIAQKVLLVWRKKRRRERKRIEDCFENYRIQTGRASIGPNVNVRCG